MTSFYPFTKSFCAFDGVKKSLEALLTCPRHSKILFDFTRYDLIYIYCIFLHVISYGSVFLLTFSWFVLFHFSVTHFFFLRNIRCPTNLNLHSYTEIVP